MQYCLASAPIGRQVQEAPEDAICPVGFHEFMAHEISGANLVVIDDSGRLSSIEQPDVVTEELLRLFAQ
jgi:pimeloyl-ACP methyl ester carboxylesterase